MAAEAVQNAMSVFAPNHENEDSIDEDVVLYKLHEYLTDFSAPTEDGEPFFGAFSDDLVPVSTANLAQVDKDLRLVLNQLEDIDKQVEESLDKPGGDVLPKDLKQTHELPNANYNGFYTELGRAIADPSPLFGHDFSNEKKEKLNKLNELLGKWKKGVSTLSLILPTVFCNLSLLSFLLDFLAFP